MDQALTPYLVFSRNCKEAMRFYTHVFEGQITRELTFAEAPPSLPFAVKEDDKHLIFDMELRTRYFRLKASDDITGNPLHMGTNVSLFLELESTELAKAVFKALATKGNIIFDFAQHFGMLRDQFEIQWMITVQGS